ncbi:MAG: FtsQ-type POTRA domain-containing protein [Verrucomicrobia bacterium]|nr:FtsQ-type POTRA domain-containing protein [Verrucomicrobiota bacterium]
MLLSICLVGVAFLSILGVRLFGRVLLSQNDLFAIRQFDLKSDGKMQPKHIQGHAEVGEGENLFAIDIDEVRRRLEEVSSVNAAQVRRDLPDTLVIRVNERVALARFFWPKMRVNLAVDSEGYILGPSYSSPYLPSITGFRTLGLSPGDQIHEGRFHDALLALDICDTTRINQYIEIDSIDVQNPEYLDVRLKGGERVLLSRSDLEVKLRKLVSIIQASHDRGVQVASIDMTVDRNFPVEYR